MTRYAVNEARSELIATWGVGYGETAVTVSPLPDRATPEQRYVLSATLTTLSAALWRCYTHPASAEGTMEVNTEGWQRQETRNAFTLVAPALQDPNLPVNDILTVSYDPVEEAAHRAGRALYAIGDTDLTATVTGDVADEIAAVEQAELGDLSGRACQAVLLTREDVSPAQVAAADRLFDTDPLGSPDLFLRFDPTAASVAAAHWLQAAADIVADATGLPVTAVVAEADNIEALPHQTPTRVLELMELGLSPRAAVTSLIRQAMMVADGEMPDPLTLRDEIDDAAALADQYATGDPQDGAEFLDLRLTPLDPQRPARDLLEDLLAGIRGCWLLYLDHGPGTASDDGSDVLDASFRHTVRVRASADHERLL